MAKSENSNMGKDCKLVATSIEKDGVEIAKTFHRWLLTPDMDISNQPSNVQAIANATWTPEVVTAYETFKEQQQAANTLS
jgi:hypothetical protein